MPLVLLFLSSPAVLAQKPKILVKANVIRGESMATVDVAPQKFEAIFKDKIGQLLFRTGSPDQLLIDILIEQIPASNPPMAVTLSSEKGIHYFGRQTKSSFLDQLINPGGLLNRERYDSLVPLPERRGIA